MPLGPVLRTTPPSAPNGAEREGSAMTKPSRQPPTSDEVVTSEKKPRRPLRRPPVQSHYGQRQLIRTLVSRIEIDEKGATIVYRIPGIPRPPGVPDPGGEVPVLSVA